MKKRLLFTIFGIVMLLSLFTVSAFAATEVASGYCGGEGDGKNLIWTLDSDGLLTISGEGAMADYSTIAPYAPWYYNYSAQITSLSIGNNIVNIGNAAFRGCGNLTSIVIPPSVMRIGKGAFNGCGGLTSITIPSSVTVIGDGAFNACYNLTYNDYDNAKYLGNSDNPYLYLAAASSESISNCIIYQNTRFISENAFYGCSNLKDVTIPANITSIGYLAFCGCSSLASITIPDSVTSIGYHAFSDCKSLSSVEIGDNVESIGYGAFANCDALTYNNYDNAKYLGNYSNPYLYLIIATSASISNCTIHPNTRVISEYAFHDCNSLTSISIGSSVVSIGSDAFFGCNSLKDVYISDPAAWCRIDFSDEYATPMRYADNIYCNGNKIVSVTVPDDVKELNYTFYHFKSLIKATLSSGVTNIGSYAFSGCNSLISVAIPSGSVTNIGSFAFSGCSSLTSITIPDSVTSIGERAFQNCSALIGMNIPNRVTSISDYAFYYCSNLANLVIGSSVTGIGDYAFYSCSSLTSLTIPNSVISIGGYAFKNCENLTNMTIGNSAVNIGELAFGSCSKLKSVTIPNSLTKIGDRAFYSCSRLTDIYIADLDAWCKINFDNVNSNPLYYAKNLYLNGTKVELLEIPENVQVIQSSLFYNASCIKAVSIPKTLVGVAANAFKNCTGIEKVFYAGSEAEWNELAISAGNECLTGAQIFYNSTPSDYYCMVTCAVSSGGTVSVAKNAYEEGETVMVTATPYTGYELAEIRVDGVKIEGNTFTATKNHTVSAVFAKLPVYGGTETSRIGDIAVFSLSGEAQQTIPTGQCLVTVPVENIQQTDSVTVFLASYTASGQYQGMGWMTFRNLPIGTTVEATLPLDNSSGKIAALRAFVVESIFSPIPLGNAVTFGTF